MAANVRLLDFSSNSVSAHLCSSADGCGPNVAHLFVSPRSSNVNEALTINKIGTASGLESFVRAPFLAVIRILAAVVLNAIRHRNHLNTATVDEIVWSTSAQLSKQGEDTGWFNHTGSRRDIAPPNYYGGFGIRAPADPECQLTITK